MRGRERIGYPGRLLSLQVARIREYLRESWQPFKKRRQHAWCVSLVCGSKSTRRGKPQVLVPMFPLPRASHFGIPVF